MKRKKRKNSLKRVIIGGGLLRFGFLLLVLLLKDWIRPYELVDDQHFEDIATTYFDKANGIFDFSLVASLHFNELRQVLWTYVVCFTSKIFGTVYGARIFNCLVSIFNIYIVYKLTHLITDNKGIALKAAKLYAYMPLVWMFCVFPFKDVFLSGCVLYILTNLVKYYKRGTVSKTDIIISALVGTCIFLTRGAVIEFLCVVSLFVFGIRSFRKKQYFRLFCIAFCSLLVAIYLGLYIQEAFVRKIVDYGAESNVSSGNLAYIQIKSIFDVWKFPLTYSFALFQPMLLKFRFDVPANDFWLYIISLSNIASYPIVFGNIAYVFCKKYNLFFWLTTFLMFAAVICLSLGSFRHYIFLYPVSLINYVCVRSYKSHIVNSCIKYGSFAIFCIILIMSLF